MAQIQKKSDDREVPLPLGYEHLSDYGIKAIRYGDIIYLEGSNYSTAISQEIREKINKEMSVVICDTGPPGIGKTYFAIRYAQILDPDFQITDIPPPPPNEDYGQVVFGREHLSYLTGPKTPLKRGQVIVLDESHFGVGARSWQNRDQQDIVNYLAAIRSKGFILILVVLHTRMIDALLRDFVVNYEFYVTNRGEATCYRRFFPQFSNEPYKRRLGIMELPLPDEELCDWKSCLKCSHLRAPEDKRCETIRAIYERRKEWFLIETGQKDEINSIPPRTKERIYAELIIEKIDETNRTSHGRIEISSTINLIEKYLNEKIQPWKAKNIRTLIESIRPDLKTKKKKE